MFLTKQTLTYLHCCSVEIFCTFYTKKLIATPQMWIYFTFYLNSIFSGLSVTYLNFSHFHSIHSVSRTSVKNFCHSFACCYLSYSFALYVEKSHLCIGAKSGKLCGLLFDSYKRDSYCGLLFIWIQMMWPSWNEKIWLRARMTGVIHYDCT